MAKRKARVVWIHRNHIPSTGSFNCNCTITGDASYRESSLPVSYSGDYVRFVESPPPKKKARKKK